MIFGVSGIPGAGKTYYIVDWLVKNYFDKDGLPLKDYTVISNVEGLLLDHIPLDDILKDVSHEQFFTVPYQEKVSKKYSNIIYIIDECQRFFPRFMKNRDVCYYFEYHRHFGHVICLATQNFRSRVSPEISALLEYEIRAVPRSLSIGGTFRYFRIVNHDKVGTFFLRPSSKIFRLYQSAKTFKGENKHIKKPLMFPLIIAILFMFGAGYFFFTRWIRPANEKVRAVASSSSPSPSSPAGQGSPLPGVPPSRSAHVITDAPPIFNDRDRPAGFWREMSWVSVGQEYFLSEPTTGRFISVRDCPFPVRTGRRGHRVIIEACVPWEWLQLEKDTHNGDPREDRSHTHNWES